MVLVTCQILTCVITIATHLTDEETEAQSW